MLALLFHPEVVCDTCRHQTTETLPCTPAGRGHTTSSMKVCGAACLHVQVAGVEGRHVVLLLADNNITDEAMLADVNGLLNTGEVTGGCEGLDGRPPMKFSQAKLICGSCFPQAPEGLAVLGVASPAARC